MKRVFTTENTITRVLSKYDHLRGRERERYLLGQADHTRARDLNSAKLKNDLRFIQKEGNPAASQMDYIYNLVEYPSRIKKLFIKGNSKKEVPRQVLNIVTNSFQTRPKVFFSRYDVEFEEFTDAAVLPQIPPPRKDEELAVRVEQTARVEEERDQAIAQVERAEERTARAEVRANRAEADRDRVRARPLVVHDEVLEEME